MTEPRVGSTARKPVLLVVEEEDSVRHLLELALDRQGFHVVGTSSGRNALHIYREQGTDIDLVLIEVRMNGLSGPETVAKLHEINPGVRYCFMSGGTALSKADQLLDDGAASRFQKPFLSLTELGSTLRKFLND